MVYFILVEVFLIIACIFIAKKMVEKRNGLAKFINIGVDDEQAIEKMKNIAREIAETGKFEMSDKFDGYEIEFKAKEKCIEEVVIKSDATEVSYHFIDGWQTENLAYTEKGAIAYLAFGLWIVLLGIQFAVGVLAVILWLRAMLT